MSLEIAEVFLEISEALVEILPIKSVFWLAGTCKDLKRSFEDYIAKATKARMHTTFYGTPAYTIRDPSAGTVIQLMVVSPQIIRLRFDEKKLFICTHQFNEPTTGMTLYEILTAGPHERMWYKQDHDEHPRITVYTYTKGTVLVSRVVYYEYNRC